MPEREYQVVVLGSGGVGKSCLTAQFVQNVWIEAYDPTIEDNYKKHMQGRRVILDILDTAGTEQFTAMRELYMKTGQGFLLVFSLTSLASLRELSNIREQLIRIKEDTRVPLVLVGNKSDLHDSRTVSKDRAFMVAQSWGNKPYYETSARHRTNVDDAFEDLCRQIMIREQQIDEPNEFSDEERSRRHRSHKDKAHLGDDDHDRRHRRKRKRKAEIGKIDGPRCTIL